MLTGSKLLAKVKELGEVSKSDLVRSARYVSTKKDGESYYTTPHFFMRPCWKPRVSALVIAGVVVSVKQAAS
jgi:hypothetical protein